MNSLLTIPSEHDPSAPPVRLEASIACTLRERARDRTDRGVTSGRRWLPARLGVVPLLVAMLVFVAIPVAAYQSLPAIQRLFGGDNGARLVMTSGLGHSLNLSQTIAGYTVTVKSAYADSNRIVVEYMVQQPDGQPLQRRVMSDSSLRDSHGAGLRFLGGTENQGGVYLESFDGAHVAPSSGQVSLHLVIPLFAALRGFDIASPQATPLAVSRARPFVFDFTIPTGLRTTTTDEPASRVVPVNQTVTVAGQTMTLERVVLSPSETRLYLRGAEISTTQPLPVLTAGNWNSQQPSTWAAGTPIDERIWRTNGGLVVVSFLSPLTNEHGLWSLVVNNREQVVGARAAPSVAGGPWVFHFHMP